MKNIIFLSGYARSGKSTVIKKLVKDHNFISVSTSRYLMSVVFNRFNVPFTKENVKYCEEKNSITDNWFGDFDSYRSAAIDTAENHIVHHFGRKQGLIIPAFIQQALWKEFDYLVCEVFNSDEARSYYEVCIKLFDKSNITTVHLNREGKLLGVDGREELGITINNNGTLEQTIDQIVNLL